MPSHTVKIGGQETPLQEFSGYKAFKALRLVREILGSSDQIQTAITEHRRRYNQQNAIELDRAAAVFRFGDRTAHLTEEDWAASGGKLVIPQDPSPIESTLAAFPVALDVAEEQTLRLLALVLTANTELEKWDDAGDVDTNLEAERKRLPHRALAHELAELARVAVELLNDQFAGTIAGFEESDAVGKLRAWWAKQDTPSPPPASPPTSTPADEVEHEDGSPISPEETGSPKPGSSTSSPLATDGMSGPSSTEPVGAASPSSAT